MQPRIVADGGAGNDTIYGSTNPDEIDGGAGDDMLYGLDDEDNLDGGDGADLLVGGAGDDGLIGGPGTDRYFGDELRATSEWGNDVLIAVDGGPETMSCGEGVDSAVVDADDAADANCEVLSGGQSRPPRDTVGTLPLTVTIGPLADTPGGLARILRGEPIRLPVTFSAAAPIVATLRVSAAEARRLGLPRRERMIADDIGTPLTLTPLTINTQMRLRWPVRQYLRDDQRVRATLTIIAEDVNGARTTATKDITLRRSDRFRAGTCTEATAKSAPGPLEYLARMSPLRLVLLLVPACLAAIAAVAIASPPAARDSAAAVITPTRVDGIHLGDTHADLRSRGKVGPIGPGCEFGGPNTRSARLQAPLKGQVDYTLNSPRKVTTITVTKGAKARGVGHRRDDRRHQGEVPERDRRPQH